MTLTLSYSRDSRINHTLNDHRQTQRLRGHADDGAIDDRALAP